MGVTPERIEDILTPDEKASLAADLAAIHKTMYPCWDRTEAPRIARNVEDA